MRCCLLCKHTSKGLLIGVHLYEHSLPRLLKIRVGGNPPHHQWWSSKCLPNHGSKIFNSSIQKNYTRIAIKSDHVYMQRSKGIIMIAEIAVDVLGWCCAPLAPLLRAGCCWMPQEPIDKERGRRIRSLSLVSRRSKEEISFQFSLLCSIIFNRIIISQ